MKLRFAAVDCLSNCDQFHHFNFESQISLTDFDAVVIDPSDLSRFWKTQLQANDDGGYSTSTAYDRGLGRKISELFSRRLREASDLMVFRGGLLIVFVPAIDSTLIVRTGNKGTSYNNLSWLPTHRFPMGHDRYGREDFMYFPEPSVFTNRAGKDIRWGNGNRSIAAALGGIAEKAVYLGVIEGVPPGPGCEVLAQDPVDDVVAASISFGKGRLIFVPHFPGVDDKQLGAVFADCAKRLLRKHELSHPPKWASEIPLPGEKAADQIIAGAAARVKEARDAWEKARTDREELANLRALLFESGSVLEDAVRTVFKMVGFPVEEPDLYDEEYDLYIPSEILRIIGEIEGAEKQVDVAKYRQLLDYVQKPVSEGHAVKGLLIGNGFCQINPKDRKEQFTAHAINGCKSQKFCRITTVELFTLASWLLAGERTDAERAAIRATILACNEDWVFNAPT